MCVGSATGWDLGIRLYWVHAVHAEISPMDLRDAKRTQLKLNFLPESPKSFVPLATRFRQSRLFLHPSFAVQNDGKFCNVNWQ